MTDPCSHHGRQFSLPALPAPPVISTLAEFVVQGGSAAARTWVGEAGGMGAGMPAKKQKVRRREAGGLFQMVPEARLELACG